LAQSIHRFAAMGWAIEQVVEEMADHTLSIDHVGDPTRQKT
jgi:hypothetical protein